jgi:hypothetical protein
VYMCRPVVRQGRGARIHSWSSFLEHHLREAPVSKRVSYRVHSRPSLFIILYCQTRTTNSTFPQIVREEGVSSPGCGVIPNVFRAVLMNASQLASYVLFFILFISPPPFTFFSQSTKTDTRANAQLRLLKASSSGPSTSRVISYVIWLP